jgi:Ca2+-binding RTX toxin-like protein
MEPIMAFVDSYIPLNMQNGGTWNFANLNYGSYYSGTSSWFNVDYYDGTSETLTGSGFTYASGRPTGAGTVTGYLSDYYGDTLISVSGISVSALSILNASKTTSVGDDMVVIKTALAGADTIWGSDYADVLDGFNGNDAIYGYAGNDTLYGEAGNDYLNGMSGDDFLNGGTGADTMAGGLGNDRFIVDHAADRVIEAAGQGTDAVYSSVSYRLAAGQQVETFATTSQTGLAAINLLGNELAQTIVGNNGANVISGGAGSDIVAGGGGNDFIYGGAGNDKLAGGAGYDHFVFNTALSSAANVDLISDFNVVQDTIRLENAIMPGLGSLGGTLASTAFWKSATGLAHDGNDRVIYETDSGWLNYDSNGSAAGGSVHIATMAPNLALTYSDFLVI